MSVFRRKQLEKTVIVHQLERSTTVSTHCTHLLHFLLCSSVPLVTGIRRLGNSKLIVVRVVCRIEPLQERLAINEVQTILSGAACVTDDEVYFICVSPDL